MKKIVSVLGVMALATTAANAAPNYLQRGQNGVYKVTYDYKDRAEVGHWYIGGRLDLNIMNWENEYSTSPEIGVGENKDSYTEAVFGGNVFAGRIFNYFWRAEVEAGIISEFEDADEGVSFKLTVPYLMANGYYDFANGLYVGAGLGVALLKGRWQGASFTGGDSSERNVSPMVGLMAGWSYHLDYNLLLDFRYRLAMLWGPEHTRAYRDGASVDYGTSTLDLTGVEFTNDIGLILDNSISVGLRYEF